MKWPWMYNVIIKDVVHGYKNKTVVINSDWLSSKTTTWWSQLWSALPSAHIPFKNMSAVFSILTHTVQMCVIVHVSIQSQQVECCRTREEGAPRRASDSRRQNTSHCLTHLWLHMDSRWQSSLCCHAPACHWSTSKSSNRISGQSIGTFSIFRNGNGYTKPRPAAQKPRRVKVLRRWYPVLIWEAFM